MKPYYDDGQVTLYLGDCREVLPTLERVDHVITDPPYARDVYLRAATQGGIANSQNRGPRISALAAGAIGAIDEMLPQVAAEIARLTRRWGLVFSDVETCHVWRAELEGNGMRYVRTGCWAKPDPMPQFGGDRPAVGFEPATICHAPGPMRWNGGGRPALWTHAIAKGANRPDHPCPKPLALMAELVELFTDPGEVVLDPFAGSGTTLIAARNLGRRAIGIEIVERWAEAAARRIEHGTRAALRPDQAVMQWA